MRPEDRGPLRLATDREPVCWWAGSLPPMATLTFRTMAIAA